MMRQMGELGLRSNVRQISLLLVVNIFVGSMVGLERTVLPLIGEEQFALTSTSAVLSFIIAFGFAKAILNYFAGSIADRFGRRKVLIWGWTIGILVPVLVITAHAWWVIVVANILLGINQALAWSMTVNMKIDLVKPNQRGLIIGLNEAVGYIGLSLAAMFSGYVAASYSVRPEPFYFGILFAVVGLLLSFGVKSTEQYLQTQASLTHRERPNLTARQVFAITTWQDRTLASCTFAGIATNLKDGMAWGLFPIFFTMKGLSLQQLSTIITVYPVAWAITQLLTGYVSDRIGRKWLIVTGMLLQATSIWLLLLADSYIVWLVLAILLGVGTALVYPTLLAAVSDVAHPSWRASSLGIYRFWRDSGYAFGAILAGIITDLFSIHMAIGLCATLPFLAGLFSIWRMKETIHR